MFKLIKPLQLGLAISLCFSTVGFNQTANAADLTPRQQSCEVIDALISGPRAGVSRIRNLLEALPIEKVDLLASQLTKLLSGKKYTRGFLYNIGSLGNNMHEHLLVVEQAGKKSPDFFRFIYENYGGEMRVVEFNFKTLFAAIMKRNHLSPPKEIACP